MGQLSELSASVLGAPWLWNSSCGDQIKPTLDFQKTRFGSNIRRSSSTRWVKEVHCTDIPCNQEKEGEIHRFHGTDNGCDKIFLLKIQLHKWEDVVQMPINQIVYREHCGFVRSLRRLDCPFLLLRNHSTYNCIEQMSSTWKPRMVPTKWPRQRYDDIWPVLWEITKRRVGLP